MSETAPHQVPAGRVGRPHGLDGSFYVNDADTRLLAEGVLVSVGGRSAPIVRHAGVRARPILRLEGVDDRSAAQELRGMTMTVAVPEAPALAEGEWWAHELEGCSVHDGEREVGRVERLIALPSCEALEVRDEQGEQILVPMVRDAIRSVDVAGARIEVDMGFIEGAQ